MSQAHSTAKIDSRQERGQRIASKSRLRQKGSLWIVPSESEAGEAYSVDLAAQRCTCPDHTLRRKKCKHIYAVEFSARRETFPDGTTTTVTKTVRVTYTQDWRAYNAAQSEEKERFTALLSMLCATVPQPPQAKGRPRLPLADMVFATVSKVYSGFSSRRFTSDVRSACQAGHLARAPHFNSVSNYLADPAMTPVLQHLISASSLPLRAVETDFAVDSSGFGTSRFVRWFNKKYGREVDNREWVKVHAMCGVRTHIVTSVEVSGWAANDSAYFRPLLQAMAHNFRLAEVLADKAYLSHDNVALVERFGAQPFIPFKSNSLQSEESDAWTRMYHYFAFRRDEFLTHYHQRSNVETVFSMIKVKFGDSVRSKSDTGMVNEVLCKVLAHNLCVLVQSIHELGVDPTFCAETSLAQEALA